MIVNPRMVPPRGHHFPISEKVTLEAISKEALARAITEYRMRNGQAPGNPDRDIDDYVCGKWPHACIREMHDMQAPGHTHPAAPSPSSTMNQRVSLWAAQEVQMIPPGGHALVSQRIADERALVCRDCPRNHPWKTGCGSCNATAEHILLNIRKTNRTPHDDRIFGCEVGGFDCRTMVWLPAAKAKPAPAEIEFLPNACWRKAI